MKNFAVYGEPTVIVDENTPTPIADEMRRLRLASALPPEESGISGFISEQQLADQLDLSLATIRRWRRAGYGPISVKIGRVSYYRENAFAEFVEAEMKKATARRQARG